jgi:hypothetical protein
MHITYNADEFPEDDDGLLKGIQFSVTPQLDPSLRDLVERIVPLATYYTSISTFVEMRSHLDYGLVNHALCAAIRDMLKVRNTMPNLVGLSPEYLIGLSNLAFTTRTRLQQLRYIHASEVVVLYSPYTTHNVFDLFTRLRTSTD